MGNVPNKYLRYLHLHKLDSPKAYQLSGEAVVMESCQFDEQLIAPSRPIWIPPNQL